MSTLTSSPTLAEPCQARADALRAAWFTSVGPQIVREYPAPDTAIVWRLAWDPPAAGEYPRPMLDTAQRVAERWPEYADRVWHHAAGAVVRGRDCGCGAPAVHRDALLDMARELRATLAGTDD